MLLLCCGLSRGVLGRRHEQAIRQIRIEFYAVESDLSKFEGLTIPVIAYVVEMVFKVIDVLARVFVGVFLPVVVFHDPHVLLA